MRSAYLLVAVGRLREHLRELRIYNLRRLHRSTGILARRIAAATSCIARSFNPRSSCAVLPRLLPPTNSAGRERERDRARVTSGERGPGALPAAARATAPLHRVTPPDCQAAASCPSEPGARLLPVPARGSPPALVPCSHLFGASHRVCGKLQLQLQLHATELTLTLAGERR
jgi:hypothetical protein